jgi:CheY-like chemotaxis protein
MQSVAGTPPMRGAGPGPGGRGADADRNGLKLVIAEDEAISALYLEMLLGRLGHEVCAVEATADGVVRAAARHRPDLVLMDVRLAAGGDGVAAACRIRRQQGIPSLFVTADTDPGTGERLRAADPVGVLGKPYTQEQIDRALAAAAGHLGGDS